MQSSHLCSGSSGSIYLSIRGSVFLSAIVSARQKSSDSFRFHAEARFLAQSSGDLVQHPDAKAAPSGQLHLKRGFTSAYLGFHRIIQLDYGQGFQMDLRWSAAGLLRLVTDLRRAVLVWPPDKADRHHGPTFLLMVFYWMSRGVYASQTSLLSF